MLNLDLPIKWFNVELMSISFKLWSLLWIILSCQITRRTHYGLYICDFVYALDFTYLTIHLINCKYTMIFQIKCRYHFQMDVELSELLENCQNISYCKSNNFGIFRCFIEFPEEKLYQRLLDIVGKYHSLYRLLTTNRIIYHSALTKYHPPDPYEYSSRNESVHRSVGSQTMEQ